MGDVAEGEDGSVVHVHVVLGLSDGTTRGGHLIEGRVFPTLEVVVREIPADMRKVMRPDVGIPLIDLDLPDSRTAPSPHPRPRHLVDRSIGVARSEQRCQPAVGSSFRRGREVNQERDKDIQRSVST